MYHLGDGVENKMSKDEFTHPFTAKLGRIISPRFQRPKTLETTILYNDPQHQISALQGRANKSNVPS